MQGITMLNRLKYLCISVTIISSMLCAHDGNNHVIHNAPSMNRCEQLMDMLSAESNQFQKLFAGVTVIHGRCVQQQTAMLDQEPVEAGQPSKQSNDYKYISDNILYFIGRAHVFLEFGVAHRYYPERANSYECEALSYESIADFLIKSLDEKEKTALFESSDYKKANSNLQKLKKEVRAIIAKNDDRPVSLTSSSLPLDVAVKID